jgi:C4-dicarboxylate-binding protein DctP
MGKGFFLKVTGSICLALFMISILAFTPDPAAAQAKAEYKWRFAGAWTQKVRNDSIQMYCDLINKYSKGKIQIRFQHSGLLGTHDEIFHAVREGSIEMGVYAPYVNLVPGGMLNWMSWTVGSYEEAAVAYAPPKGILYQVMDKAYEEVGFKLLWSSPMGPYGFGNKVRPIKTPDDFSKLKLRVSASLGAVRTLENMGKGTGMTLQTIPWADVYNALQTGVVDGCWDLWGSLVEERHFEVLKYYTALDWTWDCGNIAMNRKLWDKLPQDLKDAIFKAGREAEARDYRERKKTDEDYKKKVAAAGLIIYYPAAAEREVFRKKANMPAVWDELCKPWLDKHYPGQNMAKKIQDELEKIRVAVAKK